MTSLDSILNVLVPAGIFLFLGILIYGKAKEPIDKFFRMVKGWFEKKDDGGAEDEGEIEEPLNYKIDYRGAEY